jgi:hypothetical protein
MTSTAVISTIDDFLDEEDLTYYRSLVLKSKTAQTIIEDPTVPANFWTKYETKLKDHFEALHLEGLYPKVTMTNSKKPVIRHIDAKFKDERYKILIYLNDVHRGGTLFFDDKKKVVITNKQNRLVLFDISLPHESQDFTVFESPNIKKLAIGFRVY